VYFIEIQRLQFKITLARYKTTHNVLIREVICDSNIYEHLQFSKSNVFHNQRDANNMRDICRVLGKLK